MIAKVTYRLFSKYGNEKFAHDDDVDFSKYFSHHFAEMMLESHL